MSGSSTSLTPPVGMINVTQWKDATAQPHDAWEPAHSINPWGHVKYTRSLTQPATLPSVDLSICRLKAMDIRRTLSTVGDEP